jgi:hypothetical protein
MQSCARKQRSRTMMHRTRRISVSVRPGAPRKREIHRRLAWLRNRGAIVWEPYTDCPLCPSTPVPRPAPVHTRVVPLDSPKSASARKVYRGIPFLTPLAAGCGRAPHCHFWDLPNLPRRRYCFAFANQSAGSRHTAD